MSAASAEATRAAVPAEGDGRTDVAFFKLLIVGLVFACTITFRAIILSQSSQHASLMYLDTPMLLALLLQYVLARFMHPGPGPERVLRVFLPLFLLTAWWGVSGMIFAKRFDFFAASFLQYFNGVLVLVLMSWILHRFKLVDFAMKAIMLGAVPVFLVAFAQVALEPKRAFEDVTSTLGVNHAHIGLYLLVVLTVALNRSLIRGGWWPATVAGLSFLVILLSGSRAATLGSLGIFGVYFFRRLSFANFLKLAAGLAIIAFVMFYIGKHREGGTQGTEQFAITKNIKIDKSAGRRLLMWIAAWGVINSSQDRFLWGIGFTNFRWEYGKLIKLPFYTNAAHDAYLHIWTETGLLGLILYLSAYGSLFLFGLRNRKHDPAAGLLSALMVAMFITGLTQETLFPNEAFCNFNVYYYFACLVLVMHTRELADKKAALSAGESTVAA